MTVDWKGAVKAGMAAGIVFSILYTFLFGFIGYGQFGGPGILLGYGQSQKFIDAFKTTEPLPLEPSGLIVLLIGNIILGIVFSAVYGWALKDLPGDSFGRGINLGIVLWALIALWSALFTNFNLLGEPLYLTLVELIFWLVLFLIEGIIIVKMYKAH